MTKQMLVSFDSLGFEVIIDYSALCHEAMIAKLADKDPPRNPIPFMEIRARANPQRFPEIWIVNLDDDITPEQFESMCMETPQVMADTIRNLGECIFKTPRPDEIIR